MSRSTTGLEPLGKFYGVDIIIGEETRIAAGGLGCRRANWRPSRAALTCWGAAPGLCLPASGRSG